MRTLEKRLTRLESIKSNMTIGLPFIMFVDGAEPTQTQKIEIDQAEKAGRKIIMIMFEQPD